MIDTQIFFQNNGIIQTCQLNALPLTEEKLMEKSDCKSLVLPVLFAVALWLVGGFFLSKELGIICVILSIIIAGIGAGKVMNSECPIPKD
jgi:hypothetical protein